MSLGSAISRLIVLAWLFNLSARAFKAFNWLPGSGFVGDCGSMTSLIGLSIGQAPFSSRLGALPVSGQSTQPASKTVDTRAMRMDRTLFADEAKNQQAQMSIELGSLSLKSGTAKAHWPPSARCESEYANGRNVIWVRPDCGSMVQRKMSR